MSLAASRTRNFLRLATTAATASLLLASATACNRKGSGRYSVGFSQMESNNPWRIAETASLTAAAKQNNVDFVVTDAQGQTAKQVSDVEDLIARRVNLILLAPREYQGLVPALQAARAAKIPVILVDREAAGTPGKDFVTVLSSNFVQQGQRAAAWLANATGGKASIVELSLTPGSSVARDRGAGFRQELAKHPGMQIIASQTGNASRAEGEKVMQNLVQSLGSRITAVYAHNDEMALGAIEALKAAGRHPGKDVTIVSVDGEKAGLQAIIAGDLGATVESNPRFGPLAFATIAKYRKGEPIPPRIVLTDRLFDRSNAAQYVNEAF